MDDDFAVQVRDDYVEQLYAGLSTEAATDVLRDEYGHLDVDEHPVYWLALAHTQFEYGRLTEEVKDQALKVIRTGEDLARWGGGDGKRKRALNALEKKLRGPQKAPKKLVKRPPKLEPGDVFRFRIDADRYGFGRVLTETERAIYKLISPDKRPPIEAVVDSEVLFVVGSTDDGFARRQWHVIGNAPLEEQLRKPIEFFHQSVGDDYCNVFDIWHPDHTPTKRHIDECQNLEQWGAWSAHHIVDRLLAEIEGRECGWISRGRR